MQKSARFKDRQADQCRGLPLPPILPGPNAFEEPPAVPIPETKSLLEEGQGTLPPLNRAQLRKALRYPALLGKKWLLLPPAIQSRFTASKSTRSVTIYQGRIHQTRHSYLGRVLAMTCRLIGSPLSYNKNIRGPATVIVRESESTNSQYWTRIYPTASGLPQVIQSQKMFKGPTGLVEMISPHFGVKLTLSASHQALAFTSAGYVFQLGGRALPLPNWLSPGQMKVTHRQTGARRFRFTLQLTHPLFGELFYQTGIFEELNQ